MKHFVAALLALSIAGVVFAESEKAAKPEAREAKAKPAKESASSGAETKQTPFGPAKVTPAEPLPAAELSDDPFIWAEEKGDLVVFRRKTPFGAQVWKKKKSELTADEQAILARGPQPEEKPVVSKPKTASKAKTAKAKAPDKK
jgi:hypothetical protein